jgi:2,3-bisphosphoglycerate-independent phosphoglycerate mutase
MHFLFLFMDGVGLGEDDPRLNPLAGTSMPHLEKLLGGKRLIANNVPIESDRASAIAIDPNLDVEGLPQSATGQATLLTGKNVPQLVGTHYGPKPNKEVASVIEEGNLFSVLTERGYRSALLNAYPVRYFEAIESGKRLYSAIPHAVTSAGLSLKTAEDLNNGKAFSVDFSGQAWRERLGYPNAPVMNLPQAGQNLAEVSSHYDMAFFEFWISDYAGHHQDHSGARQLLEDFDKVLGGLLQGWVDEEGLILVTSDHGNMEDLSTRRHTDNQVPALVIGAKPLRNQFLAGLTDLSDVTPAILAFYPDKAG